METPTEEQLNPVPEDLDGQVVVKHLLGKNIEGAVTLLEENSAHYQEDYTWMGAKAFCYYCPALVRYLRSSKATNDYLFAYGMLGTFRHRLTHEGVLIAPAILVIEEFCVVVETESERFGFDDDYAKRARCRIAELKAKINSLRAHEATA